ncbi:hypothetical protein A6U89_30070 [Agrobacterium sp. B133/95]|nr:hypothetical protein A6U88_25440 [Agrobacterium sp. B131/95]OCJ27228.1 hypothetical protein A6U89_30070 [Agrobacterium sp. B133/95]
MFVIDDNSCPSIHETNEDRQHADCVAIRLIELLTYVCRIELTTSQAGFFTNFAQRCFPCFLPLFNSTGNLAPLADQRAIPA